MFTTVRSNYPRLLRGSIPAEECGIQGKSRWPLAVTFALSLLFLLAPASLLAQLNTATLHGIVTDPTGSAIPAAQITITNTDTGVARTTVTDSVGDYTVPSLQPGNYSVSAVREGFEKIQRSNVSLQVGQSAALNLTLQVGNTSQTVTVTSTALALETTDTSLGSVMSEKQVQDLPLNGRQFSQLLELAPGVVPIDNSQNSGKAPNFGAGAVSPSVDGQTNRSNTFFVDGILDSDPFFGGFAFSPSIDDIQEFKEESHTDQAEFGQSTGAIISIVTRPGTNTLHGSAFEFFRNTVLNAQNRFAATKLPYHQNQFGGSLGGPILKNKLFFFGNYEGGRQVQPEPNYYTVPSANELSGNFNGTLPGQTSKVIYDPSTFNPITFTESPFPSGTIPASRINSGMLTFLKGAYPASNFSPAPTNANNYFTSIGDTTIGDQGNIRIDYTLGTNDILNGRYSQNDATLSSPAGLNELFDTGFSGKNAGGNWVHTFNPTTVSQITVAYNSLNIPQEDVPPVNQASLFSAAGLGAGWNESPGDTPYQLLPSITLSGGSYSGFSTGGGPIGPMSIIQVSGSLSKQLSSHAIKFGGSFYRTAMYTNWAGNSVTFSNEATWNAACQYAGSNPAALAQCPTYNPNAGDLGGGGDPVASMLLSLPISATRDLGNDGVNLRQDLTGLFVQDTWTATRKLTVNYGLRWDYSTPVSETNNRLAAYNIYTHQYWVAKGDVDLPSGPLPSYVTVGPANTITQPHYKYFQPRLGIAYQALHNTTVRLGIGRTFDLWGLPLQVAQTNRGGWPSGFYQLAGTQNLNFAGISTKPDGTIVTGENPFYGPGVLPAAPLPAGGLGFEDSKWQPASSIQWNVAVDQNAGRVGIFTLAYVGAHTEHVTIAYPYNLAKPSINPVKAYPDQTLGSPGTDLASWGNLNYEALQASFRRNVANGLSFNASFTWSHTLGLAQCGGDYYVTCIQNPYDLRAEYGPTDLDIPLIFTISATYKLPFGKNQPYFTSGPGAVILGGWQLNTILGIRSGEVINPTNGVNSDTANAGGGDQRINFVANPTANAPHKLTDWFNAPAFAFPAYGTYGNGGINSLRGPGYWDDDLSLFRDVPLWERFTLEMRLEAFDVFNHPNLGNPNAAFGQGSFNTITSTVPATGPGANREVQIGAKVLF